MIVIGIAIVVAIVKLAGPISEKMQSGIAGVGIELADSLNQNIYRNKGDMSKLPLDSSISISMIQSYWNPKFEKYENRYGKLKAIDSCEIAGNFNSTKNIFAKKESEKEETWGVFQCYVESDSGKIELAIQCHKKNGNWSILELKIQE